MKKTIGRITALLACAVLLFGCAGQIGPNHESGGDETMDTTPFIPATEPTQDASGYAVFPLVYPTNVVKTPAERGISTQELCDRGAGATGYDGNRHYSGTSVVISPYFTARVEDTRLPVYAAPVYVADGNHGALHSFASVDVSFGDHRPMLLELTVAPAVPLDSAQVFSHDAAQLKISGQTIQLKVSAHGTYTVVLNDDQNYAVTLFVRSYSGEQEQIAAYQARYGAENVTVYEPGVHRIDHLSLFSGSVLYLKAGAILLPEHTIDIMEDDAAANAEEFGAKQCNGIGLNRFPVINGYSGSDIVIAGRGTVDMTQLDWHERRGIVFSLCSNVTMDGVIVINPCEWAFITYRCENVIVTQSAVLGYRTNSDAFAICNSIDVQVSDCFARTGDDMFEVKTLGGVETAVSHSIAFRRCQAWGSKARCFGVIGEIERDVTDILFEDGIVIFRDAIWDNDRIGSLVVLRECGTGNVCGVTFRNITIHYDRGRPIQVGVYTTGLIGGLMQDITFENIRYSAELPAQLRQNSGGSFCVRLRSLVANGVAVEESNAGRYFRTDAEGLLQFG